MKSLTSCRYLEAYNQQIFIFVTRIAKKSNNYMIFELPCLRPILYSNVQRSEKKNANQIVYADAFKSHNHLYGCNISWDLKLA